MTHKKDLFGAHLSSAGGPATVFERVALVEANAVQFFSKSNQSYFAKPLSRTMIGAFEKARQKSDVAALVIHAGYLINLAASDATVEKRSVDALHAELTRCVALNVDTLVLHPGAHTGSGVAVGIEKIARHLSQVLLDIPGASSIALETMAGQGTTLGSFEELAAIRSACDPAIRHRVGFCLDTCHVFSAGHDLSTLAGYRAMLAAFDKVLGLENLRVVHLNDSKAPCGAQVDRHANLKMGAIPFEVLKACAHEMSARGIPVILETPSDDGITEYAHELQLLRE